MTNEYFEQLRSTKPDFEASLRVLAEEEAGRRTPLLLGYRPSLKYEEQDEPGHWEVWPIEFSRGGQVLPPETPISGFVDAKMFILSRELVETVHRSKLKPGARFKLYEGYRPVAEGVVTRVLLPGSF